MINDNHLDPGASVGVLEWLARSQNTLTHPPLHLAGLREREREQSVLHHPHECNAHIRGGIFAALGNLE